MGNIFVYSLVAAANATLLAAVTVMLFLPNPKRLLIGYLLGGLLVSLTIGFVIVFVVHHSGAASTTQNSISPAMDIAFGLILLVAAYVLRSERAERRRERKKKEKEGVEKGPSRVEQVLGRGSARVTFLVGVVLTLPGVSYLAALHELDKPALVQILTQPRNAITRQYMKLFEYENVKLRFTDDALDAIAESALERKIGARGLRMIIEELMLDLMYQVPNQKKVREVTITREVVLAKDKPITLIEKAG